VNRSSAILLLGGLCLASATRGSALSSASSKVRAARSIAKPATETATTEASDCSEAATQSPALALLPIPSAPFRPFFKGTLAPIRVEAFRLAGAPVTRGDFLGFLRCHPEWRRSRATASLSESTYLSDFRGDLEPGAAPLDAPVTYVSWFAARAFCASRGGRLPTTVEWERALGKSPEPNGSAAADRATARFDFAMGRAAADLPASQLRAQGVWEWTSDFNSAPVASGAAASQFCGDGIRSNAPSDYGAFLRYSFRSSLKAGYALKNLGFRCARNEAP
jgi:formylglycine-generating enzyme required for sulfatase activity